jgi:hypothetical protein
VQGNSELRWKIVDQYDSLAHCEERTNLCLFYGRTYTIGCGYDYSETNDLIFNLKISPDQTNRLKYKKRSINKFIEEVKIFFNDSLNPIDGPLPTFYLIPIPPSKCKTNPLYDDRMEQVALGVADLEIVEYFPILETKNDSQASHLSQDHRDPSNFYENMIINNTFLERYRSGDVLVLIDDVLTSGAHLSAALRHLQETFREPDVMGIFWARSERPSDFQ